MNSLVITQPMYIPWKGIIEQLRLSDIFVYYDDVQLPKGGGKGRSFETRVQLKTPNGWKWLSIPIDRSKGGYLLIRDAKFANNEWRESHIGSLQMNYRTAPFFQEVWSQLIEKIYSFTTNFLSEFNINTINCILDYLKIKRPFFLSSDLGINTQLRKSERVLAICEYFSATHYITGWGARNYIDHELFDKNGIEIRYMDYNLDEYPQLWLPFNPFVSILDLLFNAGPNSINYLKSSTMDWRKFLKSHDLDPA